MKSSILLAVLTSLRLATSALSQLFVITLVGIGSRTDALIASFVLPQLTSTLIVASLNQVLVPLFTAEPPDSRQQHAWMVFVVLFVIVTPVALLLMATADGWLGLLAPGFSAEGRALTAQLVRIQLAGVIFAVPFSALWSLQCAQGRLLWAEGAQTASTFVAAVLMIAAAPRYGVYAAASAVVLRSALDVLLLIRGLGPWRGIIRESHLLRRAWHRVRYPIAGSAYFGTEPLVNQFLTSFAGPGGLSAFFAGQQVYATLSLIANKAIAAPLLPVLSADANDDEWLTFRQRYRRRAWYVFLTTSGLVLCIALLGRPILELLIERGQSLPEATDLIWQTLVTLGGVCVGGIVGQITLTALHAMGDTKTPTQIGIVTYTIYLPAKVVAFFAFGLVGLTLASSAFFLANMIGQWFFLERTLKQRTALDRSFHPAVENGMLQK
ncbi:MAG: lipid II flippase MurJ [Anaerolineae bacterium]|nr:hypothetical protein [Candidatus Roseilinea sp.]MDW8451127.1 lipid II flippase MurJ [Anaerolineae bacterium]